MVVTWWEEAKKGTGHDASGSACSCALRSMWPGDVPTASEDELGQLISKIREGSRPGTLGLQTPTPATYLPNDGPVPRNPVLNEPRH